MAPRRLSFTRYGVFDLAHLLTLSDEPSLPLLVSERTKHLLNNLVIEDIQDPRRYAVAYTPAGYEPLNQEDDEWPLFVSVAEKASIELVDLMTTLDEWLEQLDKRAAPVAGKVAVTSGTAGGPPIWFQQLGPVPDGEIWEVTTVMNVHQAGTWFQLNHLHWSGELEDAVSLNHWTGGGGAVGYYRTQGDWFLSPGDSILAQWIGASPDLQADLAIQYAELVEPL